MTTMTEMKSKGEGMYREGYCRMAEGGGGGGIYLMSEWEGATA
jgi:hypothetical protein